MSAALTTDRPAIVWQRGVEITQDDQRHYLYDGRRYPSVTTVLGPVTGDFLFMHLKEIEKLVSRLWEEGKTGTKHLRWLEVTDMSTGEVSWQMTECDPREAMADGAYISKAGLRYLKACADRGTTCHDVLAGYASGEFDHASIDDIATWVGNRIEEEKRSCTAEEAVPYALSLWRWLDKYRPQIFYSEAPVFSDAYQYAGTADMFMYLGDAIYLVDLKTSDHFNRGWMAQVAAYAHAEFAVVDRSCAVEVEVPKIGGKPLTCGVLMATPEKAGMRVFDPITPFTQVFLPALSAWRGNAGAVGIPLPPQAVWDKWPSGAGVEK